MAIAVLHSEEHTAEDIGRVRPTLRSCAHEMRGAVALMLLCTFLALIGMGLL